MQRKGIPFLLYSYIATELLAPFFASFLILYGVFFLIRLIPLLEVVLELGINLPDFIRLFSYIFPHMLLYVIPMASMAGVIIGFTRLTNEREILALKACGISLRQMLPPVVMVASVIALLTGYFSVHLIPAGQIAMHQLMFQLAKEKIDSGIKEKKFTEALGDLVVYVDDIDEQEHWNGVYVSDMRDREQPIIIMAKKGRMKANIKTMSVIIVLDDGTLHNTSGLDSQIVRFNRYQLNIPLKPPTRIDGDDVTTLSRGSMSQAQLVEAAQEYGVDSQVGVNYLTEYHHRLALPVGCLILSLLGLPLGLQAGPGRKAVGIPLGLGFFVLYYIVFTLFRVMAEDMALPLLAGMWLPNVIFAVMTGVIFWRVEQEKPIFSERLTLRLEAVFDVLFLVPFKRVAQTFKSLLGSREKQKKQADPAWDGMLVHADAKERVFHLPGCEQYHCTNCTLQFNSVYVAYEAGFEPCPYCATQAKSYDL
ncbi:MAG: LPS export ABC transporter permease LptF [Candidatus Electrothrix scaldis]|nr:MAG: LPS export ABC transporter permease LptF [Candidatus Electrothrix sp. GW3-3]